jgi:hypothetical protein
MKFTIVYFAYLVPNKWESIILEQLNGLRDCGIYEDSFAIYMSVIADAEQLNKLKHMLNSNFSKITLINVETTNLFEFPGIKTLYDLSAATNDENSYVLYFHSKGMVSNQHEFRKKLFQNTIVNYKKYLTAFKQDSQINVACIAPHDSGFAYFNYFWCKTSYIKNHCSAPQPSSNRYVWETWISETKTKKIITFSPFIQYSHVSNGTQATQLLMSLPNYSKHATLLELVDNSRTDKNTCHSYLQTYEKLFVHFEHSAMNVAEIGICKGGSIKLWRDFFRNAQIHAIDIMPLHDVWDEIQNDQRIRLYTSSDAYTLDFVSKNFKDIQFEMVLDDGPHTLESLMVFIDLYLPLLTKNGILVIEDVQSFDWIKLLTDKVPQDLQKYIQIYDLRATKGRYDDLLFIVNKN